MPENSIDHINFEDLNKRSISPHIITHLYTADPSAHVFDGKKGGSSLIIRDTNV